MLSKIHYADDQNVLKADILARLLATVRETYNLLQLLSSCTQEDWIPADLSSCYLLS